MKSDSSRSESRVLSLGEVTSGVGLQEDNRSLCSSVQLPSNVASGDSLNSDDGDLCLGEVPPCKVASGVRLQSNGGSSYLRVASSS